jgi:CubicO group peptidase (beta-lactamase class C family)
MNVSLKVLLLVSVLFIFSCKKDNQQVDAAQLSELVEDEMDKQNIPAMSVLVFKQDAILYDEYFGKAHLGNGTDLTAEHPFLIASISKVVTGVALLQLEDQNLIDLDDPINDYLPFEVNVPGFSAKITFRMLLTHTSGIADGPSLDNEYYYGTDSPTPLGDFLEDYLVPGGSRYNATDNYHNFAPGDESEYSNVGAALIGYLVEVISGEDFNAYCKQNIFVPLGLTHTHWKLSEISGTIVQPYEYSGGDYTEIQHYTFTDFPNGGLRTTPRDLHKFFQIFVNGGSSNGQQILSADNINQMMTLQISDLDSETGLAFFKMDAANNIWGHDGGEMGVSTIAGVNSTTKVGVIVLSNMSDAKLENIMLEGYALGTEE